MLTHHRLPNYVFTILRRGLVNNKLIGVISPHHRGSPAIVARMGGGVGIKVYTRQNVLEQRVDDLQAEPRPCDGGLPHEIIKAEVASGRVGWRVGGLINVPPPCALYILPARDTRVLIVSSATRRPDGGKKCVV